MALEETDSECQKVHCNDEDSSPKRSTTSNKRKRPLETAASPRPAKRATPGGTRRLTKAALESLPSSTEGGQLEAWIETGSAPAMSSRPSSKRTRESPSLRSASFGQASQSSKTSAYAPGFKQKLADAGIYGPGFEAQPPSNVREIRDHMVRRRESVSLISEEQFERYMHGHYRAVNEDAVIRTIGTTLEGDPDKYRTGISAKFQVDPLVPDIVALKPDSFTGVEAKEIDLRTRNALSPYIASAGELFPLLCNDFTEYKGPDGTESTLMGQVTYDGAVGARAMHKMRSYGLPEEPPCDGKARTFVTTVMGGAIQHYAASMQPSPIDGGPPTYHVYHMGGDLATGSAEQYRNSIRNYRNLRDLAHEERQEAIRLARMQTETPQMERLQTNGRAGSQSPPAKRRIDGGARARPSSERVS